MQNEDTYNKQLSIAQKIKENKPSISSHVERFKQGKTQMAQNQLQNSKGGTVDNVGGRNESSISNPID